MLIPISASVRRFVIVLLLVMATASLRRCLDCSLLPGKTMAPRISPRTVRL